MQITIPIEVGSQSHKSVIWGIDHFGDNYRHQWQGKHYKIVGAQPAVKGWFKLILDPIL